MADGNQWLEILEEIKEISGLNSVLYTIEGEVVATTFPEETIEESCYDYQVGEEPYLFRIQAKGEEAKLVGRLAAAQLSRAMEWESKKLDRKVFIRNVLFQRCSQEELNRQAKKLWIEESKWLVYLIETEEKERPACMEIIRQLSLEPQKDFLVEENKGKILLVKDIKNKAPEELEQIPRLLADTLRSELIIPVRIGCGRQTEGLAELPQGYEQARLALEIGKIFYAQKDIVSYEHLGLGNMIYDMSPTKCRQFVEEVFGGRENGLDEETLHMVQKFFENNLNISETARQMYVHRNTLVYRLERLEKMLGVDIRKFEDAVKVQTAFMVLDYLWYLDRKKE